MSAWNPAALLNPKAAAKERSQKKTPNYGTFSVISYCFALPDHQVHL